MATLYTSIYDSSLGPLRLLSDGQNLIGLFFETDPLYDKMVGGKRLIRDEGPFFSVSHWLDIYFRGQDPPFLPRLKAQGTSFQERVWLRLLEIPYGEVVTYGFLAQIIALDMGREQMSAQAVGGAVSRNPISILIPCHRVVGAKGNLVGYRGGLARKAALLKLEKVAYNEIGINN